MRQSNSIRTQNIWVTWQRRQKNSFENIIFILIYLKQFKTKFYQIFNIPINRVDFQHTAPHRWILINLAFINPELKLRTLVIHVKDGDGNLESRMEL